MVCAKCGANNPAESTFCGGCGAPLTSGSDVRPAAPGFSEQATPPVIEDTPTVRSASEFVPQQPTPYQGGPELAATPPPASGFPSGAYASQAPTLQESSSGATYPAQPSGFPSGAYAGQAPTIQGSPSGAFYPAQPPMTPSGASYPAQPGFPSGAYPPAQGAAFASGANYPPTTPMPVQGGGYPGQPSQPNWGAYPGMVPPPPATQPNALIQALPLWVTIVSSLLGASVLAALTFFVPPDWAAGGRIAGIIALVLGLLVVIAFGVRAAMGMLVPTNTHRTGQIVSAVVLALLLFGYGSFGMTAFGQNTLHNLQGRALESQQKWQNAIDQYHAAVPPSLSDEARTYNEWGESLMNQQQYSSALEKFNTVMTSYTQTTAEVTQAQKDAILNYQRWGSQASQQQNYTDAVQHYKDLLAQTYCDSPCQTSTKAAGATAYYNLAEQQLTAQKFSNAVDSFKTLTTDPNYKDSTEAKKVHGDYAKALLGDGKQALTTTCSSALPIYTQLSTDFSDTPEGQEATQALAAPVQVKGHFVTASVPSGTKVAKAGLVQGVTNTTPSDQFYSILANSPTVTVQSDGTFTFSSIKQGTYELVWGTIDLAAGREVFLVGQRYTATVGALCAYNYGDLTEDFPTP